jgi:hypothetical protein
VWSELGLEVTARPKIPVDLNGKGKEGSVGGDKADLSTKEKTNKQRN